MWSLRFIPNKSSSRNAPRFSKLWFQNKKLAYFKAPEVEGNMHSAGKLFKFSAQSRSEWKVFKTFKIKCDFSRRRAESVKNLKQQRKDFRRLFAVVFHRAGDDIRTTSGEAHWGFGTIKTVAWSVFRKSQTHPTPLSFAVSPVSLFSRLLPRPINSGN